MNRIVVNSMALNTLRKSLIALLSVGWFANISPVHAYCIEEWACIESQSDETGVTFWVENRKAYPFTATVSVKGSNLQRDGRHQRKFVQTQVVEGHRRIPIMRLDKAASHKSFRYNDSFYWTPGDMHAEHDEPLYLLPYARGERYRIVQGFGGGFSHRGASKYAVDFAMPVGTPIHAARGGVVIDTESRHNRGGADRKYANYANFVTILHDDRTTGEYYHLKQGGVAVEVGEQVAAGQLIGYSGNTGFSSLPHLHFAVYRAKPYGSYESLPFRFLRR